MRALARDEDVGHDQARAELAGGAPKAQDDMRNAEVPGPPWVLCLHAQGWLPSFVFVSAPARNEDILRGKKIDILKK